MGFKASGFGSSCRVPERSVQGFRVLGILNLGLKRFRVESLLQDILEGLPLGHLSLFSVWLGANDYSKPQNVGNLIKAKYCWDSLYSTLKD